MAPRLRPRSSTRRSGASTSSSASSAAPTPTSPTRASDIYRGTEPVKETDYLTDAFGREAVSFIERHKAGPFFLELAFNAVHTPMDATDARLARFASIADTTRRTYAAMLSALDDAVGAVLGKLRESGLEDDTLVVFFSDNGGPTMLGTTINGSRNDPLRGSKRTTLEGGIRVPFVAELEGQAPGGQGLRPAGDPARHPPDRARRGGRRREARVGLDGVDLLPYLTGATDRPPHEALYWRLGGQAAIRRGDWKLVRYDSTLDTPGAQVEPARPPVSPFRLYNLADDLGETHDLSAEQPDKARELLAAWEDWDRQLARPLWGPGNAPASPTN